MSSEVHADMAGSIWKLEVVEGQSVEVDDVLAILESMKMEIPVVAEVSGVVAIVHVSEGQNVDEGTLLLTLS